MSLRMEVAAELMVGCNVSIPVKRISNKQVVGIEKQEGKEICVGCRRRGPGR